MLDLLEEKYLEEYTQRVREINVHSYICGGEIDRLNGFTYPVPFPPGLQIGALVHYLRDLQSAVDDEGRKALWDRNSMTIRDGLYHFLRIRWKEAMPKNLNLSAATESLGVLFNALYELAEEIGPSVGKDVDPRLSADPAYWLHNCIKEIAAGGGFFDRLHHLYPLTECDAVEYEENSAPYIKRIKGEKLSGKKAQRWLQGRLIDNLAGGKKRVSPTEKIGFLELLLSAGYEQAGRYSRVNKERWQPLLKAARKHSVDSTGSKWVATYLLQEESGDTTAFQKKYNSPKKVLTARPRALKGFQGASENCVLEVKAM